MTTAFGRAEWRRLRNHLTLGAEDDTHTASITKPFRGCRYEVYVHMPDRSLWSRHASLAAARRSFREAVNNRRGDHTPGALVELVDILDGPILTLEREAARSYL